MSEQAWLDRIVTAIHRTEEDVIRAVHWAGGPTQPRALAERILGWRGQLPDDASIQATWEEVTGTSDNPETHLILYFLLFAAVPPQRFGDRLEERFQEFSTLCLVGNRPLYRIMPLQVVRSGVVEYRLQGRRRDQGVPLDIGAYRYSMRLALAGMLEPAIHTAQELTQASDPTHVHEVIKYAQVVQLITTGRLQAAVNLMQREGFYFQQAARFVQQLSPFGLAMEAVLGGIPIDVEHLRRQAPAAGLRGIMLEDFVDFIELPSASAERLQRISHGEQMWQRLCTTLDIIAVNPIRAALILGDIDRASELLEMRRRTLLGATFIDNIFWMRLNLLEGSIDRAAHHYRILMDNARFFRIEPRIEFELRISREMSLTRFAEMIRLGDQPRPLTRLHARPRGKRSAQGSMGLIGSSHLIQQVREQIELYADADLPVLITGPTGTGKDVVAKRLHQHSKRRKEPYFAVNCAAFNDNLLQAELFGHSKGSFTGAERAREGLIAAARGGTLFLDEIGDTSAALQSTLLRLLENGEYRPIGSNETRRLHCRILAATNVDLDRAADAGFRSDLLYRLKRLHIVLPSLAQRPEDIPELADFFLSQGRDGSCRISRDLADHLQTRSWPGNIRQLRNEMEALQVHHPTQAELNLYHYRQLFDAEAETPTPKRPQLRETPTQPPLPASMITPAPQPTPTTGPPGPTGLGFGNVRAARLAYLRRLFADHGELASRDIRRHLGVSPATVTRDVNELLAEGLISKVEPSPAPRTHFYRWSGGQQQDE